MNDKFIDIDQVLYPKEGKKKDIDYIIETGSATVDKVGWYYQIYKSGRIRAFSISHTLTQSDFTISSGAINNYYQYKRTFTLPWQLRLGIVIGDLWAGSGVGVMTRWGRINATAGSNKVEPIFATNNNSGGINMGLILEGQLHSSEMATRL